MPISAPRLPGLRFETARPPADAELPRMDVAAFVGFASTGPVGVPVAVDDEVRFRQVFGPDLPIAWDPERGETVHAHLAPAVREFFRNGGRRCWIVRVAGDTGLETSSFRIPGMLHGVGRTLWPAYLLASSPGSWADGVSLNATLNATLVTGATERNNGILLAADSPDLLRIEWPDERVVGFFPPQPAAPPRDSTFEEREAAKVRRFADAWFFRALTPAQLPFAHDAVFLTGPGEIPLLTPPVKWRQGDSGALEIPLIPGHSDALQPGCWIRVLLDDASGGVLGFMSAPDKPGDTRKTPDDLPSIWAPPVASVEPIDPDPWLPDDSPQALVPGNGGGKGGGDEKEPGSGQGGGSGQGAGQGSGGSGPGGSPGQGSGGGSGQGEGSGEGSGSGGGSGAGQGSASGSGSGEGSGSGSEPGTGTGSGEGQGSGSGSGPGAGSGAGQGSGEANPGQGNAGQGNPGQGNAGQGNSGQGNPGQGNSGGGNSGGSSSGGGNSGGSSGGSNPGGGDSGGGNSGQGGSGQGNSGGGNSGGNSGQGGSGQGGPQSGGTGTIPTPSLYGRRAYLLVDEVKYENGQRVAVIRQAWRTMHHDLAWARLRGRRSVGALVNVELWTRRADGSEVRLPDVGLVPRHPRFLGKLPPDDVLFAPAEQLTQSANEALFTELALRRFQLAAPGSAAFAAAAQPSGPQSLTAGAGTGGHDTGQGQGHHQHGQGHGYGHQHHGHDDPQDYAHHDDEGVPGEAPEIYLPLGVPVVLRDEFYQGAYHSTRSALERDGLAAFSADLFLDPWLRNETAETLLTRAFQNAYVFQPPQPPVRMHALLPVDEVSLLAVPDAVHTGWTLNPVELPPDAPEAPYHLFVEAERDEEGHIRVEWSPVGGAHGYTLQDSPDPRFRAGVRVTETVVDATGPGTHATVVRPQPCPARLYFRVRARTERGLSPWSRAVLMDVPEDLFDICGTKPLPAPTVEVSAQGERLALRWAPAGEELDAEERARRKGTVLGYRVESSPEPSFGIPELVYEGPLKQAELWAPLNGTVYFRAAARLQRDAGPDEAAPPHVLEESPWSAAVSYTAQQPNRWETLRGTAANPQHLYALHVAMLRFCAARSDCFAVLALPRHYREPQALAHARVLTAALGGSQEVGDLGARTLSFGALYHPWTVVRAPGPGASAGSARQEAATLPLAAGVTTAQQQGQQALAAYAAPVLMTAGGAAPLRAIPPDGATVGIMATRANLVGAWAAPANQPIDGVAILDPKLPESARATFLGNKVNVIAPFPRGFMTWSEETLSDDPELRGVGVRRLLILLRRLVVRDGNTWVFEPNDAAFRRKVQRQWDGLMGMLFVRGALAGGSHAEAYRVVTDDSVNPPRLVDQGRFVVELRVAPSRPMAFLTVRLVQTGAGLTVQEG